MAVVFEACEECKSHGRVALPLVPRVKERCAKCQSLNEWTVQNFLPFTKERRDLSFGLLVGKSCRRRSWCGVLIPYRPAQKRLQTSLLFRTPVKPSSRYFGRRRVLEWLQLCPFQAHDSAEVQPWYGAVKPPRAHTALTIRCRANARRLPRSPRAQERYVPITSLCDAGPNRRRTNRYPPYSRASSATTRNQ
jgi:hypothetical protein